MGPRSSRKPTRWPHRPTRAARWSLSLLLTLLLCGAAWAESYTFFAGTQYPLTAVFLHGEMDGPTIMVQGGIQGDEPSGYVTAQVLTHCKVLKGNLIVVPRANVPSINLFQRQINVDMNRRFDQDYNRFYEDRLARVVRFLLARSDALIHLHEGSGFYNPTYVDPLRNPNRYGQSIIVDALVFGDDIELGETVKQVLDELNPRISPPDYRFKLFNTETFAADTPYPEMKKSLTCYALTALNIPALAVEVSKDIVQLDWKVMRQLEATLAILKHYGVEVVPPGFTAQDVQNYLAEAGDIAVNGRPLTQGSAIDLVPGTPLFVEPRDGGENAFAPSLALFASDRPGVNLLTAPRMPLESFHELELRLDGRPVAEATVRWTGEMPQPAEKDSTVFVCWLNGQPRFVSSKETLTAVLGDQLILEGVWGSERAEVLNFKGYVATPVHNTGQDMGWEIILDPDNFMDKYRLKNPGQTAWRYEVVRETPGTKGERFYVEVAPRQVHALRLVDGHGQTLVIPWRPDSEYFLPEGQYSFLEAWSNGEPDKILATVDDQPINPGQAMGVGVTEPARMELRQATTFAPMGAMTFKASSLAAGDLPSLY